jgi:Ca2+-transporting ATPase
MRMLREQGGPPPFEPAAGPRPRKAGRVGGPPMGGPSPMLNAPFPPMHDPRMQDPRKIRRLILKSQSHCSCVS